LPVECDLDTFTSHLRYRPGPLLVAAVLSPSNSPARAPSSRHLLSTSGRQTAPENAPKILPKQPRRHPRHRPSPLSTRTNPCPPTDQAARNRGSPRRGIGSSVSLQGKTLSWPGKPPTPAILPNRPERRYPYPTPGACQCGLWRSIPPEGRAFPCSPGSPHRALVLSIGLKRNVLLTPWPRPRVIPFTRPKRKTFTAPPGAVIIGYGLSSNGKRMFIRSYLAQHGTMRYTYQRWKRPTGSRSSEKAPLSSASSLCWPDASATATTSSRS